MADSSSDSATRPPAGSFDPALEAQRRASQRGLEDLLQDLGIERHQARQDWHTEKRTTSIELARSLFDLRRQKQRGLQSIGEKRTDLRTDVGRGREDLASRLSSLARNYKLQGQQQTQSANAAGVLEGGTSAAAAHRRAENETLDRKPIETAGLRMEQDFTTNLGRLGTSESQLRQDVGLERHRTQQDTSRQTRLGARTLERQLKDIRLRRQRGIREGEFADQDITQSEIWDAKQRRPGAF